MGPIQQGINQTIRSIGVAVGAVKANKVANKMLEGGEDAGATTTSGGDIANTMISEANDGQKNIEMSAKALHNMEIKRQAELAVRGMRNARIAAIKERRQGGSK